MGTATRSGPRAPGRRPPRSRVVTVPSPRSPGRPGPCRRRVGHPPPVHHGSSRPASMSARERVSASARTATSPGADGTVGTTADHRSARAVSPTIAASSSPTSAPTASTRSCETATRHVVRDGEGRGEHVGAGVAEVVEVDRPARAQLACRVPSCVTLSLGAPAPGSAAAGGSTLPRRRRSGWAVAGGGTSRSRSGSTGPRARDPVGAGAVELELDADEPQAVADRGRHQRTVGGRPSSGTGCGESCPEAGRVLDHRRHPRGDRRALRSAPPQVVPAPSSGSGIPDTASAGASPRADAGPGRAGARPTAQQRTGLRCRRRRGRDATLLADVAAERQRAVDDRRDRRAGRWPASAAPTCACLADSPGPAA